MTKQIAFTLRRKIGQPLDEGETIWEVAKREGTTSRNCATSTCPGCAGRHAAPAWSTSKASVCSRLPASASLPPEWSVKTDTERAEKSREMVFELLASNAAGKRRPDHQSMFWRWAGSMGISGDRYGSKFAERRRGPEFDISNPAIAVNLDACIACGACVRACREVQVNDVIGMAERGNPSGSGLRHARSYGPVDLRTCGECVQACPTGALYEKSLMDKAGKTRVIQEFDRVVDTLCPFCGVGCQTSVAVKDNRIVQVEAATARPTRTGLRQGPLRVRLCDVAGAIDQSR